MMIRPVALQPPHFARELIPESSFASSLPTIHHPMYDHDSNEMKMWWIGGCNGAKKKTLHWSTIKQFCLESRYNVHDIIDKAKGDQIYNICFFFFFFFHQTIINDTKYLRLTDKNYSSSITFVALGNARDSPSFYRMMTGLDCCWINRTRKFSKVCS